MLHVDGHIAGFDKEVADARRRVLHHQLPGGVVVLSAAVADAGKQIINLVAQPAFGQGHIQHGPFGFLLHRRQRGAQAVQLVEVDCKADGVRAGGELLHQPVVPAAFEQRPGQTPQIPLKDQPVIVFHLTRQREIQPDAAARRFQRFGQRPQLGSGCPHPVVLAEGLGPRQRLFVPAAEAQQPAQGLGPGIVQPGSLGRCPQLVGIFLPQ